MSGWKRRMHTNAFGERVPKHSSLDVMFWVFVVLAVALVAGTIWAVYL
jgi:hypothetical protein